MFLNGVSAKESFAKFPTFARMVFHPSSTTAPLLRGIRIVRRTLQMLGGGWYNTSELEEVLRKAVDPNRRIFDVPTANFAGCRVAVVASRTSDGKACVLANYRGLGQRQADAAYIFFIPHSDAENPRLIDV